MPADHGLQKFHRFATLCNTRLCSPPWYGAAGKWSALQMSVNYLVVCVKPIWYFYLNTLNIPMHFHPGTLNQRSPYLCIFLKIICHFKWTTKMLSINENHLNFYFLQQSVYAPDGTPLVYIYVLICRFVCLPGQECTCSSERKLDDQDLKINWSLNSPGPFTWIAKTIRLFSCIRLFFLQQCWTGNKGAPSLPQGLCIRSSAYSC